jgi:hypothetical protein
MRSRISASDGSAIVNGFVTSASPRSASRARLFDHRHCGHDLSRRAETALETVLFDECGLKRMQRAVALRALRSS